MNILIIAPHADDEVIGVGGTILRLIDEGNAVYVCVVTKGAEPLFSEDAVRILQEETHLCHQRMGIRKTFFLEFPSVMLEKENRYDINSRLLTVIGEVKPDEAYIPHMGDIQKDHQLVAEAAMVALRPKYRHVVSRIYAYETLSETGWNIPNVQNEFLPTVYVDISDYLDAKLEAMKIYRSQLCEFPGARSLQAMEALARFRGASVNLRAAEAFNLVREIK